MLLTLVQLGEFVSQWRKLRLTDDDLRSLEFMILGDPRSGKPVAGTGGLRKIRFAPPSWHTGKSGATRIGYAYFPQAKFVYLLTIYTKHDKDDLTLDERHRYRRMLSVLSENA